VRDSEGKEWPWSPYESFEYPILQNTQATKPDVRSTKKIPRNFFFSGEAVEQLESIKCNCFAESNADAIRIALTAYNELINVHVLGYEIFIRDKFGSETQYNPRAPLICDELKLAAGDITSGLRGWRPTRPASPAVNAEQRVGELTRS
jgi:hypothetical protein